MAIGANFHTPEGCIFKIPKGFRADRGIGGSLRIYSTVERGPTIEFKCK